MNNDDSPFASRRGSTGVPASVLDQAIDRAVRKMMHVDPPAGLRRRVLSRIEAAPSTRRFMGSLSAGRPRRWSLMPAYAVGAAALAILVLAVVVTRNSRVAPSPAGAPAVAAVEQTPAVETRASRTPVPDAAPLPRPTRRVAPGRAGFRREPIPMPVVADIFGPPTTAIAAATDPSAGELWTVPSAPDVEEGVAALAPLVVRPVGVPPIETPPIVIAPLVVGRPPGVPPSPPK